MARAVMMAGRESPINSATPPAWVEIPGDMGFSLNHCCVLLSTPAVFSDTRVADTVIVFARFVWLIWEILCSRCISLIFERETGIPAEEIILMELKSSRVIAASVLSE